MMRELVIVNLKVRSVRWLVSRNSGSDCGATAGGHKILHKINLIRTHRKPTT